MKGLILAEKGEGGGDVPNAPPPLENEVDYVVKTWLEHKLHHTYPEPGGYNDQDAGLMNDWHILSLYYIRVSHGEFAAPPIPDTASDWQDLMKD